MGFRTLFGPVVLIRKLSLNVDPVDLIFHGFFRTHWLGHWTLSHLVSDPLGIDMTPVDNRRYVSSCLDHYSWGLRVMVRGYDKKERKQSLGPSSKRLQDPPRQKTFILVLFKRMAAKVTEKEAKLYNYNLWKKLFNNEVISPNLKSFWEPINCFLEIIT